MLRCKLVERPLKSEKPDTQKDNRDLAFAIDEGIPIKDFLFLLILMFHALANHFARVAEEGVHFR